MFNTISLNQDHIIESSFSGLAASMYFCFYNDGLFVKLIEFVFCINQLNCMQQSYLQRYTRNNMHVLPYINSKNQKNGEARSNAIINKLKQPTQQSLMLQLNCIDESLHNKLFSYRNGNLFTSSVTDRTVNELHACIKKQNSITEDGFTLWNMDKSEHREDSTGEHHESKRLSTKLETLNERMVKLSLKNVYEYDLKKYMQIMKMNKHRWSLFKHAGDPTQSQNILNSKIIDNPIPEAKIQQPPSMKQIESVQSSIAASQITKYRNSPSKQAHSEKTSLTPSSKLSKILETYNNTASMQSATKNNHQNHNGAKRKVLTEVSEITNPEDETQQISKYDIKSMLKKEGSNIVFIWLPPATYPQFYGMFTYAVTKKATICRLKKYFLFRRSLSERLFNSIIEQISQRQGTYIEGIQIITNKNDYSKIYESIGWKMKSVEGMDKIRIRYSRTAH